MKVSKEEIEHIAKLAHLNLSEEDTEMYVKDMDNIINFVNVLNSVDTENVEESIGAIQQVNVFRKDEVKRLDDLDGLLQNAPEKEDNMFKIPKVI